jgi:CDP-glucose 4,6-dehydratase
MHFLVTGHTGFKGAWLTILLRKLGHEVSGIALEPEAVSLFNQAKLGNVLLNDFRLDIRNQSDFSKAVSSIEPDFAIHLAAQSLVRDSYRNPALTFETNVLGTLNFLRSTEDSKSVKSRLVVTTDKVYKNKYPQIPFLEEDELGGSDPYSASKAMADILTQSWSESASTKPTIVARAGNVIGGGDYSNGRLLPSLLDSYSQGLVPTLRYPEAVRPWQHVLDCLDAYLHLLEIAQTRSISRIWNIGPSLKDVKCVKEVAERAAINLGVNPEWEREREVEYKEEDWLVLNSSKIQTELQWREKLDFNSSIAWTCDWHMGMLSGKSPLELCENQIEDYLSLQSKK